MAAPAANPIAEPTSFVNSKSCLNVVYFDQQTHACACVHMVENNENTQKLLKSTF